MSVEAEAEKIADQAGEFYIPATYSAGERGQRTLKHGDTFGVFDQHGNIVKGESSSDGLYHKDTRHLSQMELLVYGHRPLLLSSTLHDNNAMLVADLANPDIYLNGNLHLTREMLYVNRSKFLWQEACYERIILYNFDQATHKFHLAVKFDADFADLFEVRGIQRPRRGTVRIERQAPDTVTFRYLGLDNVERVTRLDFSPVPSKLTDNMAVFELELAPFMRTAMLTTVRFNEQPTQPREFYFSLRKSRRDLRESMSRFATVMTSNAMMNQVLSRSTADLYMLITDTPQGPYPYAGVPWFSAPFGRDGIITALQTLWLDPEVAKGVLNFLAATQAREDDVESDAEPGKILHEARQGEMARLHEVPFGLYYGSVDTTPLFILLAGRYFEQTGDRPVVEHLWPHILAALNWIDEYGDVDKDGFVEYRARGSKSLTNQGWKDSHDSISHADGMLAKSPIALCEVQAYVYAAKSSAAGMAAALGHAVLSEKLRQQAETLRQRFEAAFWCEEMGTYALALDGDKRQCKVRSSNAGQTLFTGIASPEHAERVAARLLNREGFSGWGIRTLSSGERRYNPMAYHNGSIWPHDNALIAMGLARYGRKQDVIKITQALFDAAQYMDMLRLPELFCGFNRQKNKGPTRYPVACTPQAWASATPFGLLEACLGLQCNYSTHEIRFEQPVLPPFLDEVSLRNLKLGEATVDILLRRHANDVAVNVTDRRGDAKVVVVN
ncbi:MAG: glycogen debranching N-terminal domain-containing protein [Bdellovibrionales bacterium]